MSGLSRWVDRLRFGCHGDDSTGCRCEPSFDGERLVVDASACPLGGMLATSPDCRQTVIGALTERDVETVVVETAGIERTYEDASAALLVAAGRFVERVASHDERLAELASRDPLEANREATGRADVVATIAAETGLAELATRQKTDSNPLTPAVRPRISHWCVDTVPPPDSALRSHRRLDTGATVRVYARSSGLDQYHLDPVENALDTDALALLTQAFERLAAGHLDGGGRAPRRAVQLASESAETPSIDDRTTATLGTILHKHARGHGLLEDIFTDATVSDAFITAPACENPVRVTVDGETLVTNLRPTDEAITALASRFRRESGRAFSRADPALDATTTIADRSIRVAGVTEPTSDGTAFAFRAADENVWTLPALVRNNTLSSPAAALLSVAVERGSALLTAGARGAGKTTLLGALLWELPSTVRTVVIEDTPELPIRRLQQSGRDVQRLHTSRDSEKRTPRAALRTALRLGDGALVVGEVRGAEAAVLYEAMRVGANSEAVLGTIHGDGGEAVYERVVSDLGVPPSSFGATDLVVTCEVTRDGTRRLSRIEEVLDDGQSFATLFKRTDSGLEPTGRIARGNSGLIGKLATPEESYAAVREVLDTRERLVSELAARDHTAVTHTQGHTEATSGTAMRSRRPRTERKDGERG